jgi:energy-coupling factor transporter ATP-binding protein EcfA2
MSIATRTDTQSPALHVADRHDLIRVQGARENNLKDVSIEIPKRRLTVFTGVSGSGKSSLVFGTIAAESQRLINETYSAFVQGFMPTLARPEVAWTLGWFLPNGFRQPMRNGQATCCGRDADRGAVRASVAVSGLVIATTLVATDLVRHGRRAMKSSSVAS